MTTYTAEQVIELNLRCIFYTFTQCISDDQGNHVPWEDMLGEWDFYVSCEPEIRMAIDSIEWKIPEGVNYKWAQIANPLNELINNR